MPPLRSNHGKGERQDQRERKFRALMRFFPHFAQRVQAVKGRQGRDGTGKLLFVGGIIRPFDQDRPNKLFRVVKILKLIFHANLQVPHHIY
jgi:hypothetical protein